MPQLHWLNASVETDASKWSAACADLGTDTYYLPEYAALYRNQGTPFGVLFKCDVGTVLYPILLRSVRLGGEDSPYCDLISPYGYGGPAVQAADPSARSTLFSRFLEAFDNACHDRSVISEFIRFHPLLENAALYPSQDRHFHHDTVVIDLDQSPEQLWRGIRKGHKSSIRKAQRSGVEVRIDPSERYLDAFMALYHSTMERQSADELYFLPETFFRETVSQLDTSVFMAVAMMGQRVLSAAMFLAGGSYVHYHFSGSDPEGLDVCANHALLYEVMLRSRQEGYLTMNLGGGLSPNDSLLRFKAGFSPLRKPFFSGRRIHDHAAYCRLIEERFGGAAPQDASFFPLYRSPAPFRNQGIGRT